MDAPTLEGKSLHGHKCLTHLEIYASPIRDLDRSGWLWGLVQPLWQCGPVGMAVPGRTDQQKKWEVINCPLFPFTNLFKNHSILLEVKPRFSKLPVAYFLLPHPDELSSELLLEIFMDRGTHHKVQHFIWRGILVALSSKSWTSSHSDFCTWSPGCFCEYLGEGMGWCRGPGRRGLMFQTHRKAP